MPEVVGEILTMVVAQAPVAMVAEEAEPLPAWLGLLIQVGVAVDQEPAQQLAQVGFQQPVT
jgi:hypothetical protein